MDSFRSIIIQPMLLLLLFTIGALIWNYDQLCRADTSIMHFPYEMPDLDKTQFLATLQIIKVGDTYEKIISLLGHPFKEATIRGKKIDDPIQGPTATYYLKKIRPEIVNEVEDEYILLVFDINRILVSGSTNIKGLSLPPDLQKNWPSRP